MINILQRQIIDEARQWIGTPFKQQGRLKNIGCDCLGLLMGIAGALNLNTRNGLAINDLDQTNYSLMPDGHKLEYLLDLHLNVAHKPIWGGLALLEFDKNPQHLAIISNNPNLDFGLIHADLRCRKVIEHGLSQEYLIKIKKIYHLTN